MKKDGPKALGADEGYLTWSKKNAFRDGFQKEVIPYRKRRYLTGEVGKGARAEQTTWAWLGDEIQHAMLGRRASSPAWLKKRVTLEKRLEMRTTGRPDQGCS